MSDIIETFSFGYEGWGSETELLVKGADAVEEARGFVPPVFIDTRIRREVRAKGFKGNAFGKFLGEGRYVWFPDLGNDSIITGEAEVRIHRPAAAGELVDIATELSTLGGRIIFFCHCPIPAECHRSVVADLLLENAARRGIDLTVDEWPGGEPVSITTNVQADTLKQVLRGRRSIPIARVMDLPRIAGLPWGSAVNLKGPGGSCWVTSGPARVTGGKWYLPVFSEEPFDSEDEALESGHGMREAEGIGRRISRASRKK